MTRFFLPAFACLIAVGLSPGAAQAAEQRQALPAVSASARTDGPAVASTDALAARLLAEATSLSASTGRRSSAASPGARVQAARRAALREPEREHFLGAVQVYPWTDGTIYRLYTAPERVSDIALQPGETLVSVAAGDTVRWVIGDTTSGSGAARRTHILVKPSAPGLRTNLVIATDRRIYHVDVESLARTAMTGISWTYPADALLALQGGRAAEEPVAAGVAVEALNFNYRIEGDRPPWRPLRAFDDGRQVFIEFPATLGEGEAPPLFVRGERGRAELVNYRLRGRYYVVDRLFGAAELRLGERRQQVVRIVRHRRPS